jgi:hypothetical protein
MWNLSDSVDGYCYEAALHLSDVGFSDVQFTGLT